MEAWGFITYTIALWLWANKLNYFQSHHIRLVIERPASSIRRWFLLPYHAIRWETASSFLFLLPSTADLNTFRLQQLSRPLRPPLLSSTSTSWNLLGLLGPPFSGVPVYFQFNQHSQHLSSHDHNSLSMMQLLHHGGLIAFPLWGTFDVVSMDVSCL